MWRQICASWLLLGVFAAALAGLSLSVAPLPAGDKAVAAGGGARPVASHARAAHHC